MAPSIRLAIHLNNAKEETYITDLLEPLFLSMGIGQFKDYLATVVDSNCPVLGRGGKANSGGTLNRKTSFSGYNDEAMSISDSHLRSPSLSLTIISKVRRLGRRKEKSPLDLITRFPWSFHHRTQLLDVKTLDVVAKQEFYEISSKLPLISILDGLADSPMIRYGINVKALEPMEKFYRCLLDREPFYKDSGFCCFDLGEERGVKVQLSLKKSPHLGVMETTNAILVSQLESKTVSCAKDLGSTRTVLKITDPDGNVVGIQQHSTEHYPCNNWTSNNFRDSISEDEDCYCSVCDSGDTDSDFGSSLSTSQGYGCSLCRLDYDLELSRRNKSRGSILTQNSMKERERTDSGFVDKFEMHSSEIRSDSYQRTEC